MHTRSPRAKPDGNATIWSGMALNNVVNEYVHKLNGYIEPVSVDSGKLPCLLGLAFMASDMLAALG